jgi:hypothetical protein
MMGVSTAAIKDGTMRPTLIKIFASIALISSASAVSATTALTVGDSLTLKYWFPSQNTAVETQTFTYAGPGQTVPFQLEQDSGFAQSALDILSNNQIAFRQIGCSFGPCIQNPTPGSGGWNGPVLFDNTNGMAFSNWAVISDTLGQPGLGIPGRVDVMGITDLLVAPGEIGVNWQGAPLQGQVVLGGPDLANSAVPEPATWALMLLGFAGIGIAKRRSKINQLAVA